MSHDTTVARRQVEITNSLGLHLRPADKFVKLALRFQAEIRVHYNGNEFNGKSILDLTTLAAECGTRLELEARGPDAEAAVEALADLVSARFYENENGDAIQGQPDTEPGPMNLRDRTPRADRAAPGRSRRRPGSSRVGRAARAHARSQERWHAASGILEPGRRPDGHRRPMQVLRGIAVSPGIAIGPVAGARPARPAAAAPQRSPPRRSPPSSPGSTAGLDAAVRRGRAGRGEARHRLGPQYADILAAHARMIADPTLRADARPRIEREQIAAEHAVIEVLEAHAIRLERLTDSHLAARAADVRDIEAADPRPVDRASGPSRSRTSCRPRRWSWPTTSRPARRRGSTRSRVLGLRHRGGRPGQPHGHRRRRAGDPRRGRPGQVPRPGPAVPDGDHRRRRGAGHPRPRPADPDAIPHGRRRAVGPVPGPLAAGRPAGRDARRRPRSSSGATSSSPARSTPA